MEMIFQCFLLVFSLDVDYYIGLSSVGLSFVSDSADNVLLPSLR